MEKYEKYGKYLCVPFGYALASMMEDMKVSEIKTIEQLARFSTRYLRHSVARINDTAYVYFDREEFHEDLEGNYIPYTILTAFNMKGGDYKNLRSEDSTESSLDLSKIIPRLESIPGIKAEKVDASTQTEENTDNS